MSTTTYRFSTEGLYNETVAALEAAGVGPSAGVTSFFGPEYIEQHGKAPRYVWVPARTRVNDKEFVLRSDEEHRALIPLREHVEIGCWGRTRAEAAAMRDNLLIAFNRLGAGCDIQFESGDWQKRTHGANVAGFLYILEVSLGCVVQDAYIPTTGASPLEVEDPVTFYPVAVEGQFNMPKTTLDEVEQPEIE